MGILRVAFALFTTSRLISTPPFVRSTATALSAADSVRETCSSMGEKSSAAAGVTISLTTTDDLAAARRISRLLVERKLARCVQMDRVTSIYEWKGNVEEAEEFRLTIKAPSLHTKLIEATILEVHNYDLPQIVSFEVTGGSEKYLNWVNFKDEE